MKREVSFMFTVIVLIVALFAGCGELELTEDVYKTGSYTEYSLDKWAADIFNNVYES